MPDRIDVPSSAFEVKPLFSTFPDKQIVEEVREWVKSGHAPYAWRGHTHSRPAAGEATGLRYVARFRMPKGHESPCPCCTPFHNKFMKGYIAWFPESATVRLMGRNCFKTLAPNEHLLASQELDERTAREADIAYLIANLSKVSGALKSLEVAIAIAGHLDELQDRLGPKLIKTANVNLWQAVRNGGMLMVSFEEPSPTANGRGRISQQAVARVDGISLIDPGRTSITAKLRTAERALKKIDQTLNVETCTDVERRTAAKSFSKGMSLAAEAIRDIDDAKQFLSPGTIGALRMWGARPDAPINLYIRREGFDLYIGKAESNVHRITLPSEIETVIPRLPEIVTTDFGD